MLVWEIVKAESDDGLNPRRIRAANRCLRLARDKDKWLNAWGRNLVFYLRTESSIYTVGEKIHEVFLQIKCYLKSGVSQVQGGRRTKDWSDKKS